MKSKGGSKRLRRMIILVLALIATWLLWSGLYKPLLLMLGAFSCVVTFGIVRRMGYFDNKLFALHFRPRILPYWLWLGREIWRSSIDVARIVLHPDLPISPRILDIKATSNRPYDHVILGNSITLTPGTLSLDVHKGVIKVHALTESSARELAAGEMDRRVTEIKGG